MGINQTYKNRALASLEGKWGTACIATLILALISGGISTAVTLPFGSESPTGMGLNGIWSLLCLPLQWGYTVYFLKLIRKEDIRYESLFDGYKDFIRIFLAEFLVNLATSIGMILLIIPGIIIGSGLVMTGFILKDDKEISAIDAMKKSWEMTDGHKGALVLLFLSFLGWIILSIFTLGIGMLFLYPYMQTALAHCYEDLKAEKGM